MGGPLKVHPAKILRRALRLRTTKFQGSVPPFKQAYVSLRVALCDGRQYWRGMHDGRRAGPMGQRSRETELIEHWRHARPKKPTQRQLTDPG